MNVFLKKIECTFYNIKNNYSTTFELPVFSALKALLRSRVFPLSLAPCCASSSSLWPPLRWPTRAPPRFLQISRVGSLQSTTTRLPVRRTLLLQWPPTRPTHSASAAVPPRRRPRCRPRHLRSCQPTRSLVETLPVVRSGPSSLTYGCGI